MKKYPKPSLLVIQTDQQQFFTMQAYGNNVIQTPALNELASKSYVFEKGICYAGRLLTIKICFINRTLSPFHGRCLQQYSFERRK